MARVFKRKNNDRNCGSHDFQVYGKNVKLIGDVQLIVRFIVQKHIITAGL